MSAHVSLPRERGSALCARLDAVGQLCPIPLTRTARRMKTLRAGEILELVADDRVVLIDLPNWCRSWGHEYLGHEEAEGVLHLFVRKRERPG